MGRPRAPYNLIEKQCSTCRQMLPFSDFAPSRKMALGLQANCNQCSRKWHRDRPEYVKAKGLVWRAANPTYGRDWQRWKNYGVTPDDVDAMAVAQNNRCAGCADELRPGRGTNVDHFHVTGRVRGLLCRDCNVALGLLSDDPAVFRRLAVYLDNSCTEAEAY